VNNPLDVQENYEHALDFALHLSRLFSVSVNLDFSGTAHAFFPERLSNHCHGLSRNFSKICTKFDAGPLSDSLQNRIITTTTTLLQIKGRKNIASSQLRKISYTDFQDMQVLSFAFALRYYNCCKDDSTSPGNYGCPRD
jgi:hypothetical protein